MSSTFKFPNGYNVEVLRMRDIVETLDKNVIDPEVVLEVISHTESEIARVINEKGWAGIPFIGSIRRSKLMEIEKSDQRQALIKEARETLTVEEFNTFKKNLYASDNEKLRERRTTAYIISMEINKHKALHKWLVKKHGIAHANLLIYLCRELNYVEPED